ncbi:hypothetical protein L249_6953 [Ophiocordyceps polyrhachis-furcata BCC 54312]|uniref:Uncharacterized protein n=1 Tax=Ophiocordyceps polyrhachis-furcata BCC 54312 TaxID=1330021 RepID=A0A367LJQ0_9HYPO|nr:hypothetical protein L249_6953 [Ophiocordyceps polyrhachis-furcata BCC 54312]
MLKIPYNRLHVRGKILFAARSGRIHSFSLNDGKHISTWQHPDDKNADSEPPPAKRQRRNDDDDNGRRNGDNEPGNDAVEDGDEVQGGKKTKTRSGGGGGGRPVARVPDRAVVTQLTSSLDGRYVVAVSGHDKIIWVFDHDGNGNLKPLSRRTMPKRPSAIAISDPDSNIICADKFGDVYSLPLKYTPSTTDSTTARRQMKRMGKTNEPAASTLTVHSKRNLEALKNQAKQLQKKQSEEANGGDKVTTTKAAAANSSEEKEKEDEEEEEGFELSLLLGHVSMLTSLLLANDSKGRKYIITADRDEHIRISRYAPQAHVIQAFCQGHTEFVNALLVMPDFETPQLLLSAGGDHHLITWHWLSGKLLSQTSILDLARRIVPETDKVAVSGLVSLRWPSTSESEDETYILAICEDINAIFTWHLSSTGTLNRPGAIELASPPLDISVVSAADGTNPLLVVAVNPGQSEVKSLQSFRLTIGDENSSSSSSSSSRRLAVRPGLVFGDAALEADETDASPAEIRQLLYTVENLRKQTGENEGASHTDVAVSET